MSNKSKLRNMLDNLINDRSEQAQVEFHDYLQGKMHDTIHGPTDDNEVQDDNTKNTNEE